MWYFSADWHLGHSNIIKYCNRPFLDQTEKGLMDMINSGTIPARDLHISQESTDRMTDTILASTNAVVGRKDKLVIVGDFCFTPKENRMAVAKKYRERINCENVYLIWGNHDDRRALSPLFAASYDQYIFHCDGQDVFASHYPCRSWDKAHHGAWSVYGHVHDLFYDEDNGELMPYQKQVYAQGFKDVLKNFGNVSDDLIQKLLEVVASTNGIDLTIDVGVDNSPLNTPFGTPWSMDDIHSHFIPRMDKWRKRSDEYRKLSSPSRMKGPKANPKF